MLRNIANILKSSGVLKSFTQGPLPTIRSTHQREDEGSNQSRYSKTATVSGSMLVVASVALFMQKYKEAKCFFGKKVSKDNIESFTNCTQYPANSPIEDRYAYGRLTSVDGFAAGVFDGHGGWQVCNLKSRIRIQIHNFRLGRGTRENKGAA